MLIADIITFIWEREIYIYICFIVFCTGGDVDAARGRFDAAIQGLMQKDEESDSENESDSERKVKVLYVPNHNL